MNKNEKERVAITSGVVGVILLILVLYLSLSGAKAGKEQVNSISNAGNEATLAASRDDAAKSASFASTDDIDSVKAGEDASSSSSTAYEVPAIDALVSGNSFYPVNNSILKKSYNKVSFETSKQLEELLKYWNDGNQAAIRDLVSLERFEAMSFSLSGTKDFYYYGDKDESGLPEGFGVAVYAENQYYFGQWKQGKREGEGTWFSFYPEYNQYAVKEHLYTGSFADDLPNGNGQEHFDYNYEFMNDVDLYLQNVIGNFKDGFYDGDMYIILVKPDASTTEWDGTCIKGDFQMVPNSSRDTRGRFPVMSQRENEDNHVWMYEDEKENQQVKGIISGGKVR